MDWALVDQKLWLSMRWILKAIVEDAAAELLGARLRSLSITGSVLVLVFVNELKLYARCKLGVMSTVSPQRAAAAPVAVRRVGHPRLWSLRTDRAGSN
jgi:hypothetical protein